MKRNSVLWYDNTGKQRRFVAIGVSDTAVEDVLRTASVLHETGAAQWVIYFGDKGTPIKLWGITPAQAKVFAGMYKPLNQVSPQHAMPANINR